MNKKILLGLLILTFLLQGCGSKTGMQDGFYSAEMSGYSHGWKEYVCIMVKGGKIVYTEFNAKDPSGYIKAWDNAYMQNMASVSGTIPTNIPGTMPPSCLNIRILPMWMPCQGRPLPELILKSLRQPLLNRP